MKKRLDRHDAIRKIVHNNAVRSQHELVKELNEMDYSCTQATISRDIAELGLRKLPEGIYVLAEDLHLQRMVSSLVTEINRVNNLIVIKSSVGAAQGVAAALDAAELPEVMGTVAGDDAILIIAFDDESAAEYQAAVQKLIPEDN